MYLANLRIAPGYKNRLHNFQATRRKLDLSNKKVYLEGENR